MRHADAEDKEETDRSICILYSKAKNGNKHTAFVVFGYGIEYAKEIELEDIDMPYSAEISRQQPTCFLFVIDQSGSMADPWGGASGKKKAEAVPDIINRLLRELTLKCRRDDGVRPYIHVGVIGYGAQLAPAFGGSLSGKELVPITEIADSPARIEERSKKEDDGAGGLVERNVKFPIWIDPVANGGTPMCHALAKATEIVRGFLDKYPGCYPPVVFHITDGESTDGDPSATLRGITSLSSSDGNVLLFNLHISAKSGSVVFPASGEGLADEYASMLFNAASELPPHMRQIAKESHQLATDAGAKAFLFNADSTLVIQALDIGSQVTLK